MGPYMVSVMVDMGSDTPLYLMEKHMSEEEAERFAEDCLEDIREGLWPRVYNTYVNPERIVTVRVAEEREDNVTDRGRARQWGEDL